MLNEKIKRELDFILLNIDNTMKANDYQNNLKYLFSIRAKGSRVGKFWNKGSLFIYWSVENQVIGTGGCRALKSCWD